MNVVIHERISRDGECAAWATTNSERPGIYCVHMRSPWNNTGSGTNYKDEIGARNAVDYWIDDWYPGVMRKSSDLSKVCEEFSKEVLKLLDELDKGLGGERRHEFPRERLFYFARVIKQATEMQDQALETAIRQRNINAQEVERLRADNNVLGRLLSACEMHLHLLQGHSPSVDQAMERAVAKCLVEEGR